MSLDPNGPEALWDELSLVEDWLSGGLRRGRPRPDFSAQAAPAGLPEAVAASEDVGPEASAPGPAMEAEAGMEGPGPATDMEVALAPPGKPLPPRPTAAEAAALLKAMDREVAACTACRLASGRKKTVFGMGVPNPVVLVVGEGPGGEEDASGLPFVGPAGQLLDRMLSAIGVSRMTNAYIANIVKCRPPGNRDPAPDEMKACSAWLEAQVDILQPAAILCLGRIAAQALTGSTEGITKLRGRWFSHRGIPLVATFHPSALLRDESYKRPAWEDLKALREKLGDVLLP
jgi:DNA polymerase